MSKNGVSHSASPTRKGQLQCFNAISRDNGILVKRYYGEPNLIGPQRIPDMSLVHKKDSSHVKLIPEGKNKGRERRDTTSPCITAGYGACTYEARLMLRRS